MLTDGELVNLRAKGRYRKVVRAGIKTFVRDLANAGKNDFKPEVSTIVKVICTVVKARLIRNELCNGSVDLLERLVNCDMRWPRTPQAVKAICEADSGSMWLRYDITRVDALFGRSRYLMTDAEYRDLLKELSTINTNKNDRLCVLLDEINVLHKTTLRSLATREIFDDIIKLQNDTYYEQNETRIEQAFLEASQQGALGRLPRALEGGVHE